ncbi:hypothetical protein DMA11_14350 [Marinilabiliaceae bacterium JC017]|nr:hypothetical protein DMA11_14350 [Marinilabiliaceae bacterium JC017]
MGQLFTCKRRCRICNQPLVVVLFNPSPSTMQILSPSINDSGNKKRKSITNIKALGHLLVTQKNVILFLQSINYQDYRLIFRVLLKHGA